MTRENHAPDQEYLHLLEGITFRPIFILGPHRSGTTLLYNLLVSSGAFNYVSLYHLLHFDELLYNRTEGLEEQAKAGLEARFEAAGLSDRVIDVLPIAPNAPEEYGFLLQRNRRHFLRQLLKPYPGPFANRYARHQQINQDTLPLFSQLCQKVQFLAGVDRPVLIKNPYDFCNFHQIKELLPQAVIIFNHRHTLHVLNSQLSALHAIFKEKHEALLMLDRGYARLVRNPYVQESNRRAYEPGAKRGLRMIAPGVVWNANAFTREIKAFPADHYVSIRYEDLCADPRQHLGRVLEHLGLLSADGIPYDTIQPRHPRLRPEVEAFAGRLKKRTRAYLAYHGYEE